jgi:hypothetical protein
MPESTQKRAAYGVRRNLHELQTPLIIVESGSMGAMTSVDDSIGQPGLIPCVDEVHRRWQWMLMHNEATARTSETIMEYLSTDCDVIKDWPAMSPDLNPTQTLWAIMKHQVRVMAPTTPEELTQIVMEIRESVTQERFQPWFDPWEID